MTDMIPFLARIRRGRPSLFLCLFGGLVGALVWSMALGDVQRTMPAWQSGLFAGFLGMMALIVLEGAVVVDARLRSSGSFGFACWHFATCIAGVLMLLSSPLVKAGMGAGWGAAQSYITFLALGGAVGAFVLSMLRRTASPHVRALDPLFDTPAMTHPTKWQRLLYTMWPFFTTPFLLILLHDIDPLDVGYVALQICVLPVLMRPANPSRQEGLSILPAILIALVFAMTALLAGG